MFLAVVKPLDASANPCSSCSPTGTLRGETGHMAQGLFVHLVSKNITQHTSELSTACHCWLDVSALWITDVL